MIRRVAVPVLPPGTDVRPVRLLAISDERSPTLEFEKNRAELGSLDAIVGCGDLEPDYLRFLGDAFKVPLLYVRGNHDRDAGWVIGQAHIPEPLEGRFEHLGGLLIAGLSWPGKDRGRAERDGTAAWWQAMAAAARAAFARRRPDIVISHAAPRGHGDALEDHFHRGFSGYRWLCRTLRPAVWLHGHTPISSAADWRTQSGETTLLNVTGGVLIELTPRR